MDEEPIDDVSEDDKDDSVTPRGLNVLNAVTGFVSISEVPGSKSFTGKLGSLWVTSNSIAKDFVEAIEKKFEAKNKLHAFFPEKTLDKAPGLFKRFTDGSADFKKLCNELIKLIAIESNRVGGGRLPEANVIFVHYKREFHDDQFGKFLIVMVRHRGAFEFNDRLQPKKLKRIDIEALLQAASLDLNLFEVVYPTQDGDAYLKFIQGTQTSEFFKVALGCSEAIPNKRSLDQLKQAVKDFIAAENIDRDLRYVLMDAFNKHIDKVMSRQDKEKRKVRLDEVVVAFEKALPEDHQSRKKLSKFINSGGYEVSEVFEPTGRAVRDSKKIKIADDGTNFDCYISEDAVGYEGEEKPVLLALDASYVKIPLNDRLKQKMLGVVGKYEPED